MSGASGVVEAARRGVLAAAVTGALALSGCAPVHPDAAPEAPAAVGGASAAATLHLPVHPRIYFFGDSWTYGKSAETGRGFVQVTATSLGATAVRSPNGSGTGFVHVYQDKAANRATYPVRARALKPFTADAIVLEGGINDVGFPLTGYADAIDSTVATLRKKAGRKVPVIVLGPAPFTFPVSASARSIDRLLAAGAKRDHYSYVSALQEQWMTATNAPLLIDPVTKHPSTAGHAYLGGRLAASIRVLEGLAP